MKREKKVPAFTKEADLCAAFIAALPPGWTPYPETQGWDILLVRDEDGYQIGIQAKLKLNTDVINQTIEQSRYMIDATGPDCRAVLVPADETNGLVSVCGYIGVTIIRITNPEQDRYRHYAFKFEPRLPNEKQTYTLEDWHEMPHRFRHKLPDYVPDVIAGASAPTQLSEWKIGAIKIVVTLEKRGHVTRNDFKHFRIDHRRWVARESGWLIADAEHQGNYLAGPGLPDFKRLHPVNFEQIAADFEKWKSPELPLMSRQKAMI
jgi:hypothetical protein